MKNTKKGQRSQSSKYNMYNIQQIQYIQQNTGIYLCHSVIGQIFSERYWIINTSSILIRQIWKPPDVAKANGHADHGEKIFSLIGPIATHSILILLSLNVIPAINILWSTTEMHKESQNLVNVIIITIIVIQSEWNTINIIISSWLRGAARPRQREDHEM